MIKCEQNRLSTDAIIFKDCLNEGTVEIYYRKFKKIIVLCEEHFTVFESMDYCEYLYPCDSCNVYNMVN